MINPKFFDFVEKSKNSKNFAWKCWCWEQTSYTIWNDGAMLWATFRSSLRLWSSVGYRLLLKLHLYLLYYNTCTYTMHVNDAIWYALYTAWAESRPDQCSVWSSFVCDGEWSNAHPSSIIHPHPPPPSPIHPPTSPPSSPPCTLPHSRGENQQYKHQLSY